MSNELQARTASGSHRAATDAAGNWNRRFDVPDYVFGTEPNEWLRSHADVWKPGQRILSVADGEGRNGVWLARQGLLVDAFDVSEVGIAKARALASSQGVAVNFSVSDCDAFPWPEAAYDGIVAIFIQFADPGLRERLFQHMRRALKPGGFLVLQGYTLKQLEYRTGGPGIASHLYSPEMLRAAFDGMDIIDLREYEAELAEGPGHSGRSALLGLVARKR